MLYAARRRSRSTSWASRDSILDDETGVLVKSTDEFARSWIDLALDTPRRERYSRAAREWAAKHNWGQAVDAVAELVDAAMQQRGRR